MILFIIIAIALLRGIISVYNAENKQTIVSNKQLKLRIKESADLIADNFIDSKQLFIKLNKELPNVMLVNSIDADKAITLIEKRVSTNVSAVYKHREFDFATQQAVYYTMVIVTSDKSIIEIGSSYVEVLHTASQASWTDCLVKELADLQLCTTDRALTRNICISGFARQIN